MTVACEEASTVMGEPYAALHEHVADELERWEARVRWRLCQCRETGTEQPLRGLVLSEEEIASLLSQPDTEVSEMERRARDELCRADQRIAERLRASANHGVALPLPRLAARFGLTAFEVQTLVACLASEVDRKYERIYAYLQDDVTRRYPSVDLVLGLLCTGLADRIAARAAFHPRAPLRRYRLIDVRETDAAESRPLIARQLELDDRIASLLLGDEQLDPRLGDSSRLAPADELLRRGGAPADLAHSMAGFIRSYFGGDDPRRGVVFYLSGRYGSGRQALAAVAARELGLPLLIVDLERLPAEPGAAEQALECAARESLLQPAVLCLRGFDALLDTTDGGGAPRFAGLLASLERYSQLAFLVGSGPWSPRGRLRESRFVHLACEAPDDAERARLWTAAQEGLPVEGDLDVASLAGKFRFTPGQVRDALSAARDGSFWEGEAEGRIGAEHLQRACRDQSSTDLVHLTTKIEPRYGWDDIVLPEDSLLHLREVCQQVSLRHRVMGEWGFDRKLALGKGVAVVFAGPPGTGKTMAAEIVARELGMDLYKVDLAQVVSKYIGETEKNLGRIFDAAEHGNAVLFFDEADALFGKRSEVRDSHDRYANVEVSYLLQKMEEHQGVSILSTNLRRHMDEAFLRRLQAIVEFPFPDAGFRERIWGVSFPPEAPVASDVDFPRLAREVRLSGGNIKNIALAGAFYAAEDGGVINHEHLLRATHREFRKLGRTWTEGAASAQEARP